MFIAQKLWLIFVSERRSSTALEGPIEVGAAMAMGNSPGICGTECMTDPLG